MFENNYGSINKVEQTRKDLREEMNDYYFAAQKLRASVYIHGFIDLVKLQLFNAKSNYLPLSAVKIINI